ncbi:hypothetical protein IX83_01175 [Basilea psittacipulmonis DSM 24701]|uniref:Thiol:disulfide interchange protein n=2 Tax=Basilea TaxID=1472344 RepID=A0A077DG36_9BURK|nr:hypothetical protein IX83_01175 [Basilea psittacipulmonis DSM 24701]
MLCLMIISLLGTVHAEAVNPNVVTGDEAKVLEDKIKKSFSLDKMLIVKTDIPDMYEVASDAGIFYVDRTGRYLLSGDLYDLEKNKLYPSGYFIDKTLTIPFDQLPFELAIKRVHGNGEKKVAVFEDPFCVYCHKLDEELKKLDNATIYTFVFPFLTERSLPYAQNIWCSPDPAKAWEDWMLNKKVPETNACGTFPHKDVVALARKMNIRSTPVILFPDNERVTGYIDLEEFKKHWK